MTRLTTARPVLNLIGACNMITRPIEYNGKFYDTRHGSPFDRGSADSYYGRGCNPHYFLGATYSTPEVKEEAMTPEEIEAYMAGYNYNEDCGDKKQW